MLVIKKDAVSRLFLCLLAFLTSVPASAENVSTACTETLGSNQYDELASVRQVHDGDTLNLSDGRKIRLIGINTPELARDHKPAEAYASEARNALSSLFYKNKSIGLVFGRDKKDHYGRFLAQTFSADGQNVQATLIAQGYAYAIAIPPNTQYATCYLELEQQARCEERGLWKNTPIIQARNLKKSASGFHLVEGKVVNIRNNKKGLWLDIDDRLTIGIRPDDQSLFDIKKINKLLDQSIIVRGWINKSDRANPFYIRVRHPLSIQLSTENSCR